MQPSAAPHQRARTKGVNPVLYWLVRGLLQPFFVLYLRMERIGREYVPRSGAVILAANHRSFLDPFVIACISPRPLYYVAKRELFCHPVLSWLLGALGAFPVERGASDQEMVETARAILARGEALLIFPEGTRIRPGSLGSPRRGVGRLALETGAPVVPVAVIGTEAVRRGWRIRPRKIRIRAGRALSFPAVRDPSPELAAAVTERIWPCVMLQWEWLGGLPPLRRAAVIGAGEHGMAVAAMLARAGLQVDQQAMPAADLQLSRHDLVCFAVPAAELPAAVAAHGGQVPRRAGVLVVSEGLVPPLGTLPSAYVAERVPSWAVAALDRRETLVLAAADRAFARQIADALGRAGVDVATTSDVATVAQTAERLSGDRVTQAA